MWFGTSSRRGTAACVALGGFDVPGNPMKFGRYNSMGTMIPSPELDNRGRALRAEFGRAPRAEVAPPPPVR